MSFKSIGLAAALVLLAASGMAAAQTAPSAQATQLAHRLVRDQAGGDDYMAYMEQSALAGFDRFVVNSSSPDIPARRAALQQAFAQSQADIDQLQEQIAGIYAANLTEDELTAWIAFLETPEGRSIQAKKAKAGWPLGQPDLTPAEQKAQSAFNTSPAGQSIAAKNNTLMALSVQASMAFQQKLSARANAIYCQSRPCPTTPAPQAASPST